MSSPLSLAPARAAHLRASGLHLSFGERPVLAGVDLVDELTAALGTTPAAVVIATHDRQLLRDTESWPRLAL